MKALAGRLTSCAWWWTATGEVLAVCGLMVASGMHSLPALTACQNGSVQFVMLPSGAVVHALSVPGSVRRLEVVAVQRQKLLYISADEFTRTPIETETFAPGAQDPLPPQSHCVQESAMWSLFTAKSRRRSPSWWYGARTLLASISSRRQQLNYESAKMATAANRRVIPFVMGYCGSMLVISLCIA